MPHDQPLKPQVLVCGVIHGFGINSISNVLAPTGDTKVDSGIIFWWRKKFKNCLRQRYRFGLPHRKITFTATAIVNDKWRMR